MTKREGAILTASTGIMCCRWEDFHQVSEELLGRPVMSHEFANKVIMDELKEKSKDEFFKIVENQTL